MPAKRNVQLRSCSLCGRTGHNRARCKNIITETKIEKKAKPTQKTKLSTKKKLIKKNVEDFFVSQKTGLGKPIIVRSEINTKSSPHIINLKQKEETIWDKVGVYQEKSLIPKQNVVVDFGKMVKLANATRLGIGNRDLEARKVRIHKPVVSKNLTNIRQKFKINLNNLINWQIEIKDKIFSNFQSSVFSLQSGLKNFNYKKLAYTSLVLSKDTKLIVTWVPWLTHFIV